MTTNYASHNMRNVPSPAKVEMVTVDAAQLHASVRLTDNLVAYGLGACVCVCVYDHELKIAGMANIPLPGSPPSDLSSPRISGRYCESAIASLLEEMRRAGAVMSNLRAAIAGGAKVLNPGSASLPHSLQLGLRNIKSVTAILESKGIPILGKDVGGSYGRTIVFRTCDGTVISKRSGADAEVIAKLKSMENRCGVDG